MRSPTTIPLEPDRADYVGKPPIFEMVRGSSRWKLH